MSTSIFQSENLTSQVIGGQRITKTQIRDQNLLATMSIANIVKSSLGPVGLDKMMVDDIGEVTITNDGATILSLLEVEHPAGKILVDLAKQQDREVGDGTTSVVLIANELLKLGSELINKKLHPTTIISGYRIACKEACKYISDILSTKEMPQETIKNIAKTSIASKIIGFDSEFFSELAIKAVNSVKITNNKNEIKYPIQAVNVLKSHGKSASESIFIDGYALNCTVASQAMCKKINNAKIACLDMNLQKAKMHLGVNIVIDDPSKLEDIRKREIDITLEKIQKILDAGANVVFTTKGIDDLCLKSFVSKGAIAVRRCKREDLKRIAKATGATFVTTMSNLEGIETFENTQLGEAECVEQIRIGDDECIVIRGPKKSSCGSVILRGANDYMLEEMERSFHDCMCAVKRALESGSIVAGGGAVEAALSIYLENFATSLASKEQLAIAEFANALLVIPKTLAVNAAKDATDLVAKLRSYHNKAQVNANDEKAKLFKWNGLDLFEGQIINNLKAGVVEPTMSKVKSLKAATEAAIAILRIDDFIKVTPDSKDPREEC